MNRSFRIFLMLALTMAIFSVTASAATFTVNTTADSLDAAPGDGFCADAGGFCSLRAAIGEANALAGADTITLPAGTYTTTIATTNEDANANGDLDVTQDLTITGAGAGATIVQANALANTATDRVFHNPTAGVTLVLESMTVQNGRLTGGGRGGGISNNGIMTLNAVTVQNNVGSQVGGGVYNSGTLLNVNNSTVTTNTCTFTTTCFGGGIATITGSPLTSTVNITSSNINGNTSTATTAANSGVAPRSTFRAALCPATRATARRPAAATARAYELIHQSRPFRSRSRTRQSAIISATQPAEAITPESGSLSISRPAFLSARL
jgi:CSLREA domain-containing protein